VPCHTFEGHWVEGTVLVRCDPPVRRRSFVHLALLAAVIAAAATAVAVAIPWLPVSASKEREGIDLTYWLATGIGIMIFAVVAAAIVYSVWRFRVHPDDDRDGPPIHGHTGLEIVWTAIPTALVTAIAIVSAIVLHDNGDFGKNPLRVRVTAEQFTWVFTYENGAAKGVVSPDLYLPVDKTAKLEIEARDVLHSFWVPEFGQKQDAVPGRVNPLKVTPTRTGTYPVICTELCGLGHALMRRKAVVLTAAEFTSWAQKTKGPTGGASGASGPSGASGAQGGANGKAIFTSNGCDACHTLTAAGAQGQIGPDLDKLPAEAQVAGQPLEKFVRTSIVDPNAYIEPKCPNGSKCPPGVMPPDFGQRIKPADLDTLVKYLIQSSKGGGQ
jgi:cytochrome c oxidase subunit II